MFRGEIVLLVTDQMREFRLSDDGIELLDVYLGPGRVLTGAARLAQEAKDVNQAQRETAERRRRELEQERTLLEMQGESLRARLRSLQAESTIIRRQDKERQTLIRASRREMAAARKAD